MVEYKVVKVFTEVAHTDEYKSYDRVSGVGIEYNSFGFIKVLKIKKSVVIAKIKEGSKFYVEGGGEKAYLEIATHPITGLEYVRTIKDATPLDNLSSLPETRYYGPWETPTQSVEIPFETEQHSLHRRKNTTWPRVLDSVGTKDRCKGLLPVGYDNYYDGDYLIGSIGHNNLRRVVIKPDVSGLEDKEIKKAIITLKNQMTVYQIGANTSNEKGSALRSVWQLLGPWKKFVAPDAMPATCIISRIPIWGGQIYKESTWNGHVVAASCDADLGIVILDVTETMEHWRSGVAGNYGIMFVGTNESKQYNNDAFYSCFEVVNIIVQQEIDW
jgi:hypothetical protein